MVPEMQCHHKEASGGQKEGQRVWYKVIHDVA